MSDPYTTLGRPLGSSNSLSSPSHHIPQASQATAEPPSSQPMQHPATANNTPAPASLTVNTANLNEQNPTTRMDSINSNVTSTNTAYSLAGTNSNSPKAGNMDNINEKQSRPNVPVRSHSRAANGEVQPQTANGEANEGYEGPQLFHVRSYPDPGAFMPEGSAANNLAPAALAIGAIPPYQQSGPSAAKGNGAGPGGAPGKTGGKPPLDKFAYGFWAPEMKPFRKIVFKILGPVCGLSIILMWLCLPVYWGSLWKATSYTHNLTVRVIDRDGASIGSAVSQGLLSQTNLKYFVTSPNEFPTDEEVVNDLVNEGAWAAVVIEPGATANLAEARAIANSSYLGMSAINMYYAQARSETAEGSYLAPYMQMALTEITAKVSAMSVAMYIEENSGNATAISALGQAPTTLSNCVYFTVNNVRPFNEPVATAITLVGLIYMLIFSFIITMANNGCREIIAPFLTTKSYILYRVVTPMVLYLPVSFCFAMINLPFKVSFGAHYTYAGGFFLWAFTLYLGMASVGMATEFAITILGPKFMAFFLIPLIIVNVSVATYPYQLQPWIYKYGLAMPFYNVGRIVRTIIFDTKNDIAKHMGILLAWIVLSLITIPLATWLFRRESVNAHRKATAELELDRVMPDGGQDRS